MNSSAQAARAAARTFSSGGAFSPYAMFARTVVSNRIVSWVTSPIWWRSVFSVTSRRSTPSNVMRPRVGS